MIPMTTYNLIMVLDKTETNMLMCLRAKDPYEGKYNLVGGRVEDGETLMESAYRELVEETGITQDDITLHRFMNFTWYPVDMKMKVFVGRLNQDVELTEEIHTLHWISLNENFFDTNRFAGEGNIGHMVHIYRQTRRYFYD